MELKKRGSLTAAISTVSDKEILKAPTMGISNIIGARVAGISAVQASGQPGADNASLCPYAGKVVLSMLLTASEEAQVTSTDSIRMK